jgi:hypothetical protein
VRTSGRSVNDILALFDRLGDPFAGGAAESRPSDKPRPGESHSPAGHAEGTPPPQQPVHPKPGDGMMKLGFDQEDRGLLQKQAPPTAPKKDEANASKDKDGPARDVPRDQPGFLSQAAKAAGNLQHTLQNSFASALAKLANLAKGSEAPAEGSVLHGEGHAGEGAPLAKQSAAQEKGSAARAATANAFAAELAKQESIAQQFAGENATAFTAEKRDEVRTFEKAEARTSELRDELRQIGGDKAQKSEKAREGKEAAEVIHAEGALESQELRELIGHWKPESSALSEDEARQNALKIADALGEHVRCRGMLEDGARCLRKPILGIPYCREHAAAIYVGGIEASGEAFGAADVEAIGEATSPEVRVYSSSEPEGALPSDGFDAIPGIDATDPEAPVFGEVAID